MKRTLTLIRHAKSSWANSQMSDIQRPLKKRGINDAHLMASILFEKNVIPDKILCSPAQRTKETCRIFLTEMNLSPSIVTIDDNLYFQGHQPIIDSISKVEDTVNQLFVFGHQPYMAFLYTHFSKEKEIHHIPTTGIAHLIFDLPKWCNIKEKSSSTDFVIYPKLFRNNNI